MPPINRDLGRRTASVCQLWSAEPDLPVHALRSKSAVAVVNKAALLVYASSVPVSRNNFGSRRKSHTLLQEPCSADDVATADIGAAAACHAADMPELEADLAPSAAAHIGNLNKHGPCTAVLQPASAVDATATITVKAVKHIPTTAANHLTARQRWRSIQPDWSICTHQHESRQPSRPAPTVSTRPSTLGSLQYDPQAGEQSVPLAAVTARLQEGYAVQGIELQLPLISRSVYYFDHSGPVVAAIARLREACAVEDIELQLPSRVYCDLQRLRKAAYVKAAAARLQQVPLTAEAAAAAAAEQDRLVWSVPELEQVLWLLASAYQLGSRVVQEHADELRLAFQEQCKVWNWSVQCCGSLILKNTGVGNLYEATMRVLGELSNKKQLRGPVWRCIYSARALIPIMQLQTYLIQNQYGYHEKILQLQPRTWNTLGAMRMDWTTEPKRLDVVKLTNTVLKVVWRSEYVRAFQPALDMVRAVAVAVDKQLRPQIEVWDRIAVQYCNSLNGLKLKPLSTKHFPLKKKLMRKVYRFRAKEKANVGSVNWETVNYGPFWAKRFFGLV